LIVIKYTARGHPRRACGSCTSIHLPGAAGATIENPAADSRGQSSSAQGLKKSTPGVDSLQRTSNNRA